MRSVLIGATRCGVKCENTVLLEETQGPCGSVRECSADTITYDTSVRVEKCHILRPSTEVIKKVRRTTIVIMNWPERIKTQPHDDRDNCFLHFDSKKALRYDSEQ